MIARKLSHNQSLRVNIRVQDTLESYPGRYLDQSVHNSFVLDIKIEFKICIAN